MHTSETATPMNGNCTPDTERLRLIVIATYATTAASTIITMWPMSAG
jgi:hypothetical protein